MLDNSFTFDDGIEPGGLRDRNDIKLLVCYLLGSVGEEITRSQLSEIAIDNGIANYFEMNQAISELIASGAVTSDFRDCEEYLGVTERAKSSCAILEPHLPRAVREKAVNAAIKMLTLARNKRENEVTVEKLESGGYHVTFSVADPAAQLMKLTVFVADEAQVETVKENFYNAPVRLYSGIIAALTVN